MAEPPASRGTVLLVEEEQNVRTLLGKYLSDQGVATLEARNAEEALQRCKDHKTSSVNLMICDLVMDEMNGVELARQLRTYHPRLKTIYLSSHSESSVIYRGIPLTDLQFLPKPFKLKELINSVNDLLARE
jgi:CheY-like chemotaxis protein